MKKSRMTYVCKCGRPKGRPTDLACLRCWERLPLSLRLLYLTSPKPATERKIVAALAEIDNAVTP